MILPAGYVEKILQTTSTDVANVYDYSAMVRTGVTAQACVQSLSVVRIDNFYVHGVYAPHFSASTSYRQWSLLCFYCVLSNCPDVTCQYGLVHRAGESIAHMRQWRHHLTAHGLAAQSYLIRKYGMYFKKLLISSDFYLINNMYVMSVVMILFHSNKGQALYSPSANDTVICDDVQMCFTGHVWMSLRADCRQTRPLLAMHVPHVTLACSLLATSSHQLLMLCGNFCQLSIGPGPVWDCHW